MNILLLIILCVTGFVLFEIFRHKIAKGITHYFVIGIIIVIVLLVAAAYLPLSEFFSPDNTFSQTGYAVTEAVTDTVEFPDFLGIFEENLDKVKDFIRENLD
tara:strand:- start:1442 stop:1747 length:306 start_codon:yes stop_codon:yes gene_type:complete